MADIARGLADLPVMEAGNGYKNIVGNTTVVVKSSGGVISGLIIGNNTTGGTAAIYDGTSAAGTLIVTLTFGTPSGGLLSGTGMPGPVYFGPMGLMCNTGITVVTAGSTANNITVLFQ